MKERPTKEHQDILKKAAEEKDAIAAEETKDTEVKEVRRLIRRSRVFYKECAVAGWSFHDADDFWPELDEGVELALIRQKDNKYDRNAVAVAFAGDYNGNPEDFDFDLIIGYVPRTENEFIAQMMDLGYNDMFAAKITTVKNHGKYEERLRMTIYIQSKESYEDPDSGADNLHAMWMEENRYELLTNNLMYKGFVYFRWGGFPLCEHDLPEKGDHVLCLYKRESDVVVYLMNLIATNEDASPFLENPEEELYMVDDCRPYILTNSMGPIVLPLDELSFLDDEEICIGQPDQRLSKYATTQIMDILLNWVGTTDSDFTSSSKDDYVLPIPQD